ncbi:hypothetical protein Taro_050180 [Colocasia esculenta]|uniref:Uncharacterized protein n=1 Tax=Colocasia esculenta TaxID=4460 RepID=A0A843XD40_COLES|nr:hypothetical protein [Colocasia esculenta]
MHAFSCSPPPTSLLSSSSSSCSLPSTCLDACLIPSLHRLPIPVIAPTARPRQTAALVRRRKRSSSTSAVVPAASRRDDAGGAADSGGRLVDEDMIVLRKRLQEMRAAETNYEAPAHWAEWEKRYYASYGADVCHLVGLLQAFLMNTRPSVALGLLALVTLSVPTSAAVVAFNLVEAVKAVLAVLHLG